MPNNIETYEFEVQCVTGVLFFTIVTGDGSFKVKDTNGAQLLELRLNTTPTEFVLRPGAGVKVESP